MLKLKVLRSGKGVFATDKGVTKMDNIYAANGYSDRAHYLKELAKAHGISLGVIQVVADVLSPNEDFDGLPAMLEDLNEEA